MTWLAAGLGLCLVAFACNLLDRRRGGATILAAVLLVLAGLLFLLPVFVP